MEFLKKSLATEFDFDPFATDLGSQLFFWQKFFEIGQVVIFQDSMNGCGDVMRIGSRANHRQPRFRSTAKLNAGK